MQLPSKSRFRFLFSTTLFFAFALLVTSCDNEQQTTDSNTRTDANSKNAPDNPPSSVVESPRLCDDCAVFDFNGVQREYLVHIPDALPDNAPLVFMLHGSGGKAENFQGWLEMDAIADSEKFAVVYPQGLQAGHDTQWNAGFTLNTVDDVGFLSELALYLQKEYRLNQEKTFTAGYSNGGFMSYELLARSPDVFKAAASFNGTMSGTTWKRRNLITPAPVLQLSGALDETIPIDGSLSASGGWGGAPDMDGVIDFWADLNECTTVETVVINTNTTARKYQDGVNGNEVWYYLLDDFGHEFPLGEDGNIHTSELVWEFFGRY